MRGERIAETNNIEEIRKIESNSDDKISELIQEIESLEEALKDEKPIENVLPKTNDLEIEKEVFEEISEIEPQTELPRFEEVDETAESTKKLDVNIFSKRKPKPPKEKSNFNLFNKFKRKNEQEEDIKPLKSTFTLKLNKKGDLVGLNIKKPKPPKEKSKFRLKSLFKKSPKDEKVQEKEDVGGFKGKLIGIVSKLPFKKGNSTTDSPKESESKISSIVEKIKGIFSWKSK